MDMETKSTDGSRRNRWHRVTLALLGGLVTASFMFFLIVVVKTPGLDPPPESAALFIAVTAAGVVSYQLVRSGSTAGYPMAILTGLLVLVILAVVASGAYGPSGSRTNPVGPISYVVLALAVIASAGFAWRGATTPSRVSE